MLDERLQIADPSVLKEQNSDNPFDSALLNSNIPEIPQKVSALLRDGKAIVFFDGECAMCNGAVHRIYRHDQKGYFYFAPLQGRLANSLLTQYGIAHPEKLETMVLLEANQIFLRSEAVLQIARRLRIPHQFLAYAGVVIPSVIRDAVYEIVANNRKRWFGTGEVCHLPTEAEAERYL